jgi:uncharacterized protein (DUF433 family)
MFFGVEMFTAAKMLKASEAAVVARVSLRDVNRVIDEHILPEGFVSLENGRRVFDAACYLISFYFESAGRLTSEERLLTIKAAGHRLERLREEGWPALLEEDWTIRDGFLAIDLLPFVKATGERLADLAAARENVSVSQDILGGTAVISGTRVPVYDVAASLKAGHTMEQVLQTWPSLDAEKVRLAAIYTEANPLRGRPRVSGSLPEGATIVTDRRVPRRKAG